MSDKEISPEAYFEERQQALKEIEKYPYEFRPTISIADYIKNFSHLAHNEYDFTHQHHISGRVTATRFSSKKLFFFKINSNDQELQVMINLQYYSKSAKYDMNTLEKIIRKGDIIGIFGSPTRTKTGELSILALEVLLLAPCYHLIPYALKDKGLRYQERYLDLLVNRKNRQIFIVRDQIIQYLRNFLRDRQFLEVETPMMHPIAGGANAKPFITHHNALNRNLYMRIAPELYLKKIIISGFERVYEIGKQFRNESIDLTHNPEFTTCEFYWAYQDYLGLMDVTEEFFCGLVKSIHKSLQIQYNEKTIDFNPPFRRISMISELEKQMKIQFPNINYDSPEMLLFLEKCCNDYQIPLPSPRTVAKILDKLVSVFIEPLCVNPTFICDHPLIMSPLAKKHRNNPNLTERFELFIDGMEYCNAYTELNDPQDQRSRFKTQMQDKAKGDDEAQNLDEDFCKALEYGLPPTGGWGAGIDRIAMLLTDSPNIKEVLFFPAMKPDDVN